MKHPEIDEADPARLSTRSDVPPEMLRALSALKAEGPSRRTMELVASRLGDLLDAPPPVSQPAKWLWRGMGARAVALRVGVAALTIGTAAVWFRPAAREQGGESGRATSAAAPQRDVASPSVVPSSLAANTQLPTPPTAAAPPTEPVVVPPASAETSGGDLSRVAVVSDRAPMTERAASRGRPRRPRGATASSGSPLARPRAPFDARMHGQSTEALGSSADHQAPDSVVPKQPETKPESPAPAHAEGVGATPDAGVAHPVTEAPEVRLPSEVELMLDARRLAARDPRAAQRLLEQHATRFPAGVLGPEREVLAIEVLRALGQTAEAEQRLNAFRARYPNSMHLRRLSASPAAPAR